MEKIAILGASGHGRVVAEIAELTGWNKIIFFDDNVDGGQNVIKWPIFGNLEKLCSSQDSFDGIHIAIGNNQVRKKLFNTLPYKKIVSLIHPSALISNSASIGRGTSIMANAVVNAEATIGDGVIINTAATIDHSCNIEDFAHISPGSNLAGGVNIGVFSWVGIGSSITQNCSVGNNVTIGAGSTVLSDIPDNCVAFGTPCRVVRENRP